MALVAAVLVALSTASQPARATETLINGGFDSWVAGQPANWRVAAGEAQQAGDIVVSGSSVRFDAPGTITQLAEASEAARYVAGVQIASVGGSPHVTLILSFFNESGILTRTTQSIGTPGQQFTPMSLSEVAPFGAAMLHLSIQITGTGTVYLDNASLDETLAEPTPVPTPTPAETPTSPAVQPTMGASPTAGGSPSGGGTTVATRTPVSAGTATEKPRTPTKTPTPRKEATPTKTPKTPHPTETPTPLPRNSGFGGLLYNGDFEDIDAGRPAGWSKYGGTITLVSGGYRGASVRIFSETSATKWLYQPAEVEGGHWYEASGMARMDGEGEAFFRLSWYSSDDGTGSAIDQIDGMAVRSSEWTRLGAGPELAPAAAHSVRVRLMLRPDSEAPVTAWFDDVSLRETGEPEFKPTATTPATSTPHAGTPTAASGGKVSRTATATRAGGGASVVAPALIDRGSTGLRLSEVLSDPGEAGRDSAFEWVELINASTEEADTAGWRLGDEHEQDVLPAQMVPPGGYVIVAGRSAVAPEGVLMVHIPDGEIGGGLNNAGDVLRLTAPDGTEVDALSYGDNDSVFEPAPPAPPAGASLGVRLPGADADAANWGITERPTPGEANVFADPGPRAVSGAAITPAASTAVASTVAPLVISEHESNRTMWVMIGGLSVAVLALGAPRLRTLPRAWKTWKGKEKPSDDD